MPHMIPQYCEASPAFPFERQERPDNGDVEIVPWHDDTILASLGYKRTDFYQSGYFYRLSAPGYLDCTDWTGPFPTLDAAKADCRDTFDVDPDSGEGLPEA